VPLVPLGREAARGLVRRLAGRHPLGAAVVNEIVVRSGGVPLFLGELTAAAVAAASEASWRDVAVEEVPSSLQASLVARLDRLGELRATVQRCAVIGGEFDVATTGLIVGRPPDVVAAELETLVEEGILDRAGPGRFRFAHPLLEDAAYATVPTRERAVLHERLVDHLAGLPRTPPDLLAVHLESAARHDDAVRYWCRAALVGIDRTELPEAAAHARRAVAGTHRLPEGDRRDHLERRALTLLAVARQMTLSGDAELRSVTTRLRSLAAAAGDDGQVITASIILTACLQALGEYAAAERTAAETIAVVGDRAGDDLLGLLTQFLGATQVWRGRVDEGADKLEPLFALWPDPSARAKAGAPVASAICGLWSLGGLVDVVQNRPEAADSRFAAATRAAQDAEAPQALCLARCTQAVARQLGGDVEGVYALAEPSLELALDLGNDWWFVWAQILAGWSIAAAARDAGGVAMIEEGLAHLGPVRQLAPYFHGLHGQALGAAGRPEEGLTAVRHGIRLAGLTDERFFLPVLYAAEADLLAAGGAPSRDVALARSQAVTTAEAQGQPALAAATPSVS
jgi:hypothetical protein